MSDSPIGVVTISDRASLGVYEDKGGPGIEAALRDLLSSRWRPVRRLVPDERPAIEAALTTLADEDRCSLILTTGGTGPALRDVTPEATEAVCDRLLPGFGELMRAKSLLEDELPVRFCAAGKTTVKSFPLAQGEIGYGPHFLDASHAVDSADRDGAFVP